MLAKATVRAYRKWLPKGGDHGVDHFGSCGPLRERSAQPPTFRDDARRAGGEWNGWLPRRLRKRSSISRLPSSTMLSIQVADMQHSAEFYQKMFGFKVISEDKPLGILRLGTTKTLVSLNTQRPVAGNRGSLRDRRSSLQYQASRRAICDAARRGAGLTIPMPGCTSRIPMGSMCSSSIKDKCAGATPRGQGHHCRRRRW